MLHFICGYAVLLVSMGDAAVKNRLKTCENGGSVKGTAAVEGSCTV